MMAIKVALSLLLLTYLPFTQEQSNANGPNNVGPYNPTTYEKFNLDNPSTCTGVPRYVRSDRIFSITSSGNTQNTATPTSCQLTLTIDSAREPMVFKLTIVKSTVRDATVQFIIYDGEVNGRKLLGFNANQGVPGGAQYFLTTGQVVTFQLTRRERDFNYDIEIVAEPIKTDYINNNDCNTATGYGCDTYGYTYKLLGTTEIIGIIGGVFALVVLVVVVVVICCYRKQRGLNKQWKQDRLGSVNTAASIHSLNGSVPTDRKSKGMWTSESSKNGLASIRRSPVLPRSRMARRSDEDDSVFESVDSYPSKKLQSRVHNSERTSSKWNQSNARNYRPPTYQEALRIRENSECEVDSFVQGNDAHPQNTFVEREIIPRVKSSKIQKRAPPPLEEDETYDSIEPKRVTKAQNTDQEPDEEAEVSSEESDEVSGEEESGDEEEEVEDKTAVYSKPNKSKPQTQPESDQSKPKQNEGNQNKEMTQQKEEIPRNQQVQPPPNFIQGPPVQGFVLPGVLHPQPLYGYQLAQYPPQGYIMPPSVHGQSGPMQAGPMQVHHYPVPGTSDYPPPPMYPGPGHHNPKQGTYAKLVKPTDLPIYSYLVNRGYTPLDGRHSPVSTSTAASNLSGDKLNLTDDSDFTANIGSGVELMRRNTEV